MTLRIFYIWSDIVKPFSLFADVSLDYDALSRRYSATDDGFVWDCLIVSQSNHLLQCIIVYINYLVNCQALKKTLQQQKMP